jgi:hypothetical protein
MSKTTYLVRKEWAAVCHEYSMVVTPELVKEYNDYIKANFIFEGEVDFELTEQDLINAWNRDYEFAEKDEYTILNTVIVTGRKYSNGEVNTFSWKEQLGNIVKDLLDEEMWEQDYQEVYYNVDEVNDFVEDYDFLK